MIGYPDGVFDIDMKVVRFCPVITLSNFYYLSPVFKLIRQYIRKAAWIGPVVLLGLTMFFISNCKKEYSYEGGIAVYSFAGNGGSCTSPLLSGNYYLSVAMNESNTIQLQVHVTNPGKFSLQTNSRAGIIFSSTGSFSDTGVQVMTLTAAGRPDSTGDFTFRPAVNESCTFIVSVTPEQTLEAIYTLAGEPGTCTNYQVFGDYKVGQALTATDIVMLNVNVTGEGNYSIHTDTQNGIRFSASGYFPDSGLQTVTLTGSGIPEAPRNLSFTPTGDGSDCSFSLTVTQPGNPATYVLESGVGDCVGHISGNFTAATPLSSSNTYTLSVYVTELGQFTISTAMVNGMTFSYTGEFTIPGRQDVTLIGTGTPVNSGFFDFTPQIVGPHPIGGEACDFNMQVN